MCVNDSWENNIIKEKVYCPPSISLGEWRHERAKVNIGKKKKKRSIWFQNLFMSLGEKGFYICINIYGKRKKRYLISFFLFKKR